MNLITIQDLDNWKACDPVLLYLRKDGEICSDANLKKLLRGRKGWTPLEFSRMRSIPVADRVWVLLRPEVLGDQLQPILDKSLERAVRKYALKCGVPEVETWAKQWLNGEDRTAKAVWAARAIVKTTEAAAGWETPEWAAEAAWETAMLEAGTVEWSTERRWQLGAIQKVLRS